MQYIKILVHTPLYIVVVLTDTNIDSIVHSLRRKK